MKKLFLLLTSLLAVLSAEAITLTQGKGLTATDIHSGDTIYLTADQIVNDPFDGPVFLIEGMISDVAGGQLQVTIQRGDVDMTDQICIDKCVNSNGEMEQQFTAQVTMPTEYSLHATPIPGVRHMVLYTMTDAAETFTLLVGYDASAYTALTPVKAVHQQGVFTLFGQKLRETNEVAGLPAGVYIVGGHKVTIR